MKIVAISQRVTFIENRNEYRDSLDQRLTIFFQSIGFTPIPIPNSISNDISTWIDIVKPDLIVLSGGNNLGDFLTRDFTEKELINISINNHIPMLGICRGMQMIGTSFGSKLCKVDNHVSSHHKVTGEISGIKNSYHNYSLGLCPEDFKVLAHSEDSQIEAIKHLSLPIEGWMWHPRDKVSNQDDIERIMNLIKK